MVLNVMCYFFLRHGVYVMHCNAVLSEQISFPLDLCLTSDHVL